MGVTTATRGEGSIWIAAARREWLDGCPALARVAEIPFPRDKQLRRGLRQTLLGAKAAAEALRSAW